MRPSLRSGDGALLNGSGKTKDLIPVLAGRFEVDDAARLGRERPVLGFAVRQVKFGVAQIADARGEAEAEQMHEGEDMVREAGGVGVMLLDPQIGFMVQQPIEDVGGVANADVDDLGTERRILIRDVGIEEFARFGAILGIDVPCAFSLASSLEALSIRGRGMSCGVSIDPARLLASLAQTPASRTR